MSEAGRGLLEQHIAALANALPPLRREASRLTRWGTELAGTLGRGGRLLAAGNGGSAAEAQHLAGELVGRLRQDRPALAAIALCADSAGVTAISNDYGYRHVFARQVEAFGRTGDILMLLSTSGRSPNLLAAAETGRRHGLTVWGMTGPPPNPLSDRCHDRLAIDSDDPQVVQELHLVAVHAVCGYADQQLPAVLNPPADQIPLDRVA